jgi:hypothetical protein
VILLNSPHADAVCAFRIPLPHLFVQWLIPVTEQRTATSTLDLAGMASPERTWLAEGACTSTCRADFSRLCSRPQTRGVLQFYTPGMRIFRSACGRILLDCIFLWNSGHYLWLETCF